MRQRKPSNKDSPDSVNGSADSLRKGLLSQRRMRFLAHPMTSIKTDFSASESFQKVVRISRNGKMMATAGCDGIIRLWQFPSLDPLREIKGHTKEVDDLDFSPDCQKVCLYSILLRFSILFYHLLIVVDCERVQGRLCVCLECQRRSQADTARDEDGGRSSQVLVQAMQIHRERK